MVIKNHRQLARTRQRTIALRVLESGYAAIDTHAVLRRCVTRKNDTLFVNNAAIDCSAYRHIGVLGIGKCALAAGEYLENLLGKRLYGGIVLDVQKKKLKRLRSFVGTHPVPSVRNQRITKKMVAFARSLDPEQDLLIMIVSGGGSSLFFDPRGISVPDMLRLTRDLHASGATIHELNCVRKHLESVKGGKFAQAIYPLPVLVLYFSDIVSGTNADTIRTIASGPLYRDDATSSNAKRILQKYGLWDAYKKRIRTFDETPKDTKYFSRVRNFLLLTNRTALEAMQKTVEKYDLRAKIVTSAFRGFAHDALKRLSDKVGSQRGQYDVFLAGGETTVRVQGNGTGGRNQEAALGALCEINDNDLFVSAASDGWDNTEYAGAIADAETKIHMRRLKLNADEYLQRNDSHTFFRKTKDYIKTGKTGSNVADMMILMRMRKNK